VLKLLGDFIGELRAAGIPISMSEHVDSAKAVLALDVGVGQSSRGGGEEGAGDVGCRNADVQPSTDLFEYLGARAALCHVHSVRPLPRSRRIKKKQWLHRELEVA